MKKMVLCLLALTLCACQSNQEINKSTTESDSTHTDIQTNSDVETINTIPEVEYYMEDHGVMKLNGDAVSHKQKALIIAWLADLKLTPTHEYDERLIIEENSVSLVPVKDRYLSAEFDIEYGDQRFTIYCENTTHGIQMLKFSESTNIYPIDYFKLRDTQPFIRDKEVDASPLGKSFQPDFTIPKDVKVSKQFLDENKAEITIDCLYPSIGQWGTAFLNKDAVKRTIEQLLLAFYADNQTLLYKMQVVFNQVEPAAKGNYSMDTIDEIIVDGKLINLTSPVPDYSLFYHGDEIRSKYKELFGQELGNIENEFNFYSGYQYEPENDLFVYYFYGDGAIGGITYDVPYAYDVRINGNEMIIKVASVKTSFLFTKDTVNVAKNSGIPIGVRHFSDASKVDGFLSIRELINDQKENLDLYEIHGQLNEWGTYSLSSYVKKSEDSKIKKDVIFYNNFEREDGNIIFLPLFDNNLARSANEVILYDLHKDFKYCNDYAFYEDEHYAVIYARDWMGKTLITYVLDKQNKTFNKPISQNEADIYYQQLKDANPHLKADTEMILFTANGQKLLYLKGNDCTQDTVIALK